MFMYIYIHTLTNLKHTVYYFRGGLGCVKPINANISFLDLMSLRKLKHMMVSRFPRTNLSGVN